MNICVLTRDYQTRPVQIIVHISHFLSNKEFWEQLILYIRHWLISTPSELVETLVGAHWGLFRPSVRRLPSPTSVLSSSSQSGRSGLLTHFHPQGYLDCGLGPTLTLLPHQSYQTLHVLGLGASGSVLAWLFPWSVPLCRTWLDTAIEKAGL